MDGCQISSDLRVLQNAGVSRGVVIFFLKNCVSGDKIMNVSDIINSSYINKAMEQIDLYWFVLQMT